MGSDVAELGMLAEPLWTAVEREAWETPAAQTITEWAEGNMEVPADDSFQGGHYRCSRAPYCRGVQDTVQDATVEFVTWCAARQVAKTTTLTNIAGYYTAQEPCPVLFVRATKESLRRFFGKRLLNIIQQSRGLACHLLDTKTAIKGEVKKFRHSSWYGAWAGSLASVVGEAIRFLAADETDDYPPPLPGEVAALEAAISCTATFANRKVMRVCTPTTVYGPIWQALLTSLVHKYFVPCPHCGEYQLLRFRGERQGEARARLGEFFGVKFPADERDPNVIDAKHLAWYECEHCGGRIENHQKPWMLIRGVWIEVVLDRENPDACDTTRAEEFLRLFREPLRAACASDDPERVLGGRTARAVRELLDPEGRIAWESSWGTHVGFHLSGLYSPFAARSWWKFAAEHLAAGSFPEKRKAFRQHWEALPWLEDRTVAEIDRLKLLVGPWPRLKVPPGYHALSAGIDVHEWHYTVGVLAWGEADRLHVVHEFDTDDWQIVEDAVFRVVYPSEDPEVGQLPVTIAALDSGYRAGEQYERAAKWGPRCKAIKGVQDGAMHGLPWRISAIEVNPATGRAYGDGRTRLLINVDYYLDDLLLRRVRQPLGMPGSIEFPADVSEEYLRHLTGKAKLRHTVKATGQVVEKWHDVENRPVHHLDWTTYAIAIGDYRQLRRMGLAGSGPVRLSELQRRGR